MLTQLCVYELAVIPSFNAYAQLCDKLNQHGAIWCYTPNKAHSDLNYGF